MLKGGMAMLLFFAGTAAGSVIGMVILCLCQAAGEADRHLGIK